MVHTQETAAEISSSSRLQASPLYEAYWLGVCVHAFCGISVQEKKENWREKMIVGSDR